MNPRLFRLCQALAVVTIAVAAAACCGDETAPEPPATTPPEKATAPAVDAGIGEATENVDTNDTNDTNDTDAGEAVLDQGEVDPALPPPAAIPGLGPDGQDPAQLAAFNQGEEEKRALFYKLLEVSDNPDDGWSVDRATLDDETNLVVALDTKVKGGAPSIKAALIAGEEVHGTTSDFAGFTGADATLLAKYKKCDQWGQHTRDIVVLNDDVQALRLAFWCNWKDGSARELVVLKVASKGARTLADVKTIWVGEGGGAEPPRAVCQMVTDAQFAMSSGELVRTLTTVPAFAPPAPPAEGEDAGAPPDPSSDPKCKAADPVVDRFPVSL